MVDLLIATLIVLPAGLYLLKLVFKAHKSGRITLPGSAQVLERSGDTALFNTALSVIGFGGGILILHWLWTLLKLVAA
jgi:hypothetical protein